MIIIDFHVISTYGSSQRNILHVYFCISVISYFKWMKSVLMVENKKHIQTGILKVVVEVKRMIYI